MGRAPCCEKMGLKKGPWNPAEDQILISFILQHGHSNWRALPKQAGLLRCGKSCRLRWMNYLRPDIIRGNFTKDEEDTIITLHQMLGNRWSAIAARLPGRTDNEIKNVWHTHLKKRVKDYYKPKSKPKPKPENKKHSNNKRIESEPENSSNPIVFQSTSTYDSSFSPSSSTSDITSATLISREVENKNKIEIKFEENNNYSFDTEINESFWSDALYNDGKSSVMEPTSSILQVKGFYGLSQEFQFGSVSDQMFLDESDSDFGMDFFWYDLFSEQKKI